MTALTFPISGMTCAACSSRLERVLGKVDGVAQARVNLATNRAEIMGDVAPDNIVKAVEKAGFSVPVESFDIAISGMTCAACSSRLERVLRKVAGVLDVSVSLATHRGQVTAPAGLVSPSALILTINKAGFGADIIRDRTKAGEAEEQRYQAEVKGLKHDFVLGVVMTAPLIALMLGQMVGVHLPIPPWLQMILAGIVQFWIGKRFYQGAWNAAKGFSGNMDTLVALGTSAAFALSSYFVITGTAHHGNLYFEGSAVVITLVLMGKLMEARAKRAAASAIRALMALQPDIARIERDGQVVEMLPDLVQIGEIYLLRAGERAPLDGIVVQGLSGMDESHLTGESVLKEKAVGADVMAGAINGDGFLKVKVTTLAQDSTLSRMVRLVENAQGSKAPVQRLVDKISAIFVPVVLVIAILSLAGHLWVGNGWEHALVAAITVLVIACPCALGLATPTAIMVGTGLAARHGILIKDAQALEQAHAIKTVLFDKTGTLTLGQPKVVGAVATDNGVSQEQLLSLAASAQLGSTHPLAVALIEAARDQQLEISDVQVVSGRGVRGVYQSQNLYVGSARYMADLGLTIVGLPVDGLFAEELGRTQVWVALGDKIIGAIALSDEIRPESAGAVTRLHDLGLKTVMVTGDNQAAALRMAGPLNLDDVVAQCLPEDKVKVVHQFKQNSPVAMVGDGVNDAPALAAADLGIAMGGGSDVAMETAGITLVHSNPQGVADALLVARATYAKIRQNLFWAFIYNLIALPAAAFGLLTPMIAGAAMAFSSVSVVGNSLLLRKLRLKQAGKA